MDITKAIAVARLATLETISEIGGIDLGLCHMPSFLLLHHLVLSETKNHSSFVGISLRKLSHLNQTRMETLQWQRHTFARPEYSLKPIGQNNIYKFSVLIKIHVL